MHAVLPSAGVTIRAGNRHPMQGDELDRTLDIEAEVAVSLMAAQHVAQPVSTQEPDARWR
jgi:hypothetical protein